MASRGRTLLIVDDDAALRRLLVPWLRETGIEVREAASAEEALAMLRREEFDAVLSDVCLPGADGVALVEELRANQPDTPVVLMTAFGSIGSAVQAMRAGAFDYVTKPFELEAISVLVERAFERRAIQLENRRLRRARDRSSDVDDLVGESAAIREIRAQVQRVAGSRSGVLITGESGTGKEVVARLLHYCGPRRSRSFVPVNCGALPEGLLESELFGHARGAFTGADASKRGLFEVADGGTLFLDEIGELGGDLQGKLLRVIQDHEIRPVGGTESVHVDVRLVAATNRDLPAAVAAGTFREDLFYRLDVIPIHIPPLRERREDIPPLAELFLREHAGDVPRSFSAAALERLVAYDWPGNARELENVIERALALCDRAEIAASDLPLDPRGMLRHERGASVQDCIRAALRKRLTLRELDDHYIGEVLDVTRGNKVQAARILGIDRKTLYRRAARKVRDSAEDRRAPGRR